MTKSPIVIKDSNCNDSIVVTTQELKIYSHTKALSARRNIKKLSGLNRGSEALLGVFVALCEIGLSG
jgi:hypothetical protein